MDLKLEGILETLLVGAMVSLVVLSFVFFMFGHIWDVPVMRRFFNTLFGERESSLGRMPESALAEVARSPQAIEQPQESPMSFTVVLLLALLYGLGVITEAGAHYFRKDDDAKEKYTCFQTVARGQLKSGVASPRLARFISDFDACRAVPERKDEPRALCAQINERVLEFFHNAKNAVYQKREFYEELSVLESRINFMRSFYVLSAILLMELGLVFVIAAVSEYVSKQQDPSKIGVWTGWMRRFISAVAAGEAEVPEGDAGSRTHEGAWSRGMKRIFSEDTRGKWLLAAIELGEHWVRIAAFHILLLGVGCAALFLLCRYASNYSEDQFALRVFGYYFALSPGHEDGEDATAAKDEAMRDVTPESPYHVFSLRETTRTRGASEQKPHLQGDLPDGASDREEQRRAAPWHAREVDSALDVSSRRERTVAPPYQDRDPHTQRRLEPSAVQILGDSSHVLIASDQGGVEPFWLFTLNEDGTRLEHPTHVDMDEKDDQTKLEAARSIESLAAFENGKMPKSWNDLGLKPCQAGSDHKTFRIFAGPNRFDLQSVDSPMLLSFCLDPEKSPLEISGVEGQSVASPCEEIQASACEVEGIALRSDETGQPELLLGLQSAGSKATVVIVRMRLSGDKWDRPEQVFPAKDKDCSQDPGVSSMLQGGAGISDLTVAPSGRIYVTTSVQHDGPPSESRRGKDTISATSEVGGALWLVDLGCDSRAAGDPCRCATQKKATLLDTFIHKPDGVTHDEGSVLLVFDDEARRKSRQWAPKTFPLAQDEAVFAVVRSPEHK